MKSGTMLGLAFLVGVTLFGNPLLSQENGEIWHTRYKPAVDEAKQTGKDLLIVYTGTEWIDICRIFERDILSQEAFLNPVSEKYSLVKLEYPENNRLPANLAREYQLLKDAYRIRGFPMVVVTDPEGKPFGVNGFQPISAGDYAKIMLAMLKGKEIRDSAAKRASSLKGIEKAEALIEAIPDLPGTLSARYYKDRMKEVIELDPGNKTGKSDGFKRQLADVEYSVEMQKLGSEVQYDKMIGLTDRYISEQDLKGEQLQKALLNKLGIQQKQKNTAGSVQTLLEIVKADPESHFGKSAQKMLDRLRAQKIQDTLVK